MQSEIQKTWALLARNDHLRYFAKKGSLNLAGTTRSQVNFTYLINSNPGFDWYVTLNPTKGGPPKARSRDVTEWAWILLDVDPMTPDAQPEAALDYILDKHQLREYCAVLDSGRGRQAWVQLRPLQLLPEEASVSRGQVERATSAWLRSLDPFKFGCRVDTSCSDLSRVARCPGTINSRTSRQARIISTPVDYLSPNVILSHAKPEEPGPPPRPLKSGSALSEILPRLSQVAARFLTEGVISPGRHSSCYATARSLMEAGIGSSEATTLLLVGAQLCHPPLPIRDTIRALRQAYEKEKT